LKIFQQRESEVRSYSRAFPTIFTKAKEAYLFDTQGKQYIDFLSGAGTVNYGHNNAVIKQAIIDYLQADGVVHSLDMATVPKQQFLEKFESVILKPRNLDYKIQFSGPTGTNAVEAALKLARKVKKRSNVIAFTNSFHGLSSGALSVTSNSFYRHEVFTNRTNVSFMPYDGYFGKTVNTIDYLKKFLEDKSSGIDLPAAIILETVQADGGINVATASWLQQLEQLCRAVDILLIVDDIQVGNGRTGSFFSFERAGIQPDIVTLSKSIGGFGLPLSLVLIKPALDQWEPGEHTGTFRGNNLALVAAIEALRYWETDDLSEFVKCKSQLLEKTLLNIQASYPKLAAQVRGIGLIYGLDILVPEIAQSIAREAFNQGLIIERCGATDKVLKFLPPLIIEDEVLKAGLEIIEQSINSVVSRLTI
jgi:diaminobutyrate-2-oxoglutarate transaminase